MILLLDWDSAEDIDFEETIPTIMSRTKTNEYILNFILHGQKK